VRRAGCLQAEGLFSALRQRDHLPRWQSAETTELRSMRARDVVTISRWQHLAWLLVAATLVQGQFIAVGRAVAQSGPQSQVDAEGVAHVQAIRCLPRNS
jgi:hypothetical protein